MDWYTWFTTGTAVIGFLIALAIFFGFRINNNHYWTNKNVPHTSPFWFLPNMLRRKKQEYFETEREWVKKYGKAFGSHFLLSPVVYVSDPDLLRRIFVKDFQAFADRRTFQTNSAMVNSFLTILTGEDWKRVRSVITPAFASGKLKKMLQLMGDCAVPTTQHLIMAAETGKPEECKRIFGGFTIDVIASSAFGIKLDSASDPDNEFVKNARQIFQINFPWRALLALALPKVANFFNIQAFPPNVMSFFTELTLSVVERRTKNNEVRDDFLQVMLEAQKNGIQVDAEDAEEKDSKEDDGHAIFKQYQKNKTISNDEFVAQCILFFLAGYDTTATTLSMTVYYMALNPECQEKLVQEVDEIWRKYPTLDPASLPEMKYLEAAINETLRMAPPAPRTERKTTQDYQLGDTGITIAKGMFVQIPIYAMHYNDEWFPEPDKYKPERFLPENKDEILPYTYLPFGAGPRNCIAMRFALLEIKICLLHVFREVTFETCSETKVPLELYRGAGLFQPKAVTLKVNKRKPTVT